MKRYVTLLVLCLILCTALFTSCGKNDGTPEGFQLVSDPETDGFYFYLPEDWYAGRTSGILTGYLSSLSTVNVTATYVTTDKTEMTDYWSASETELREDFSDYVLTASSTDLNISDRPTYYYAYEGSYAGVRYGFRQYFILAGNTPADGMFVLTYTASKDENPQTRTVDYEETSGYMDSIAGNFRLTGALPQGKTDLALTDAEAPAGMKKANRFTSFGLDFYVPNTWNVDLSDGFIGASLAEDGTAVGLEALSIDAIAKKMEYFGIQSNGLTQMDLVKILKAEYGEYLTDFTVEEDPFPEGADAQDATTVGETSYRRMTFTGKHGAQEVRVSVYLLWETGHAKTFYLLTYTATPTTYETHLNDVEQMLGVIRYQ